MKKTKRVLRRIGMLVLVIIILLAVIVFWAPEAVSENLQPQEISTLAADVDVIIIFNAGGWGNILPGEAESLSSIIRGTRETLESLGYTSVVIPYNRTKNTLLGEAFGFKDFLNKFEFSSRIFAAEVETLAASLPDKKIIITGLSFGGSLTKQTMERVSKEIQVYAIAVGIPFWHKSSTYLENVLQLDNDGQDSLVEGKIGTLLSVWAKTPFKWIFSRIEGQDLTFAQAMNAPGHDYFWRSPAVGPKIVTFLGDKFKK